MGLDQDRKSGRKEAARKTERAVPRVRSGRVRAQRPGSAAGAGSEHRVARGSERPQLSAGNKGRAQGGPGCRQRPANQRRRRWPRPAAPRPARGSGPRAEAGEQRAGCCGGCGPAGRPKVSLLALSSDREPRAAARAAGTYPAPQLWSKGDWSTPQKAPEKEEKEEHPKPAPRLRAQVRCGGPRIVPAPVECLRPAAAGAQLQGKLSSPRGVPIRACVLASVGLCLCQCLSRWLCLRM